MRVHKAVQESRLVVMPQLGSVLEAPLAQSLSEIPGRGRGGHFVGNCCIPPSPLV